LKNKNILLIYRRLIAVEMSQAKIFPTQIITNIFFPYKTLVKGDEKSIVCFVQVIPSGLVAIVVGSFPTVTYELFP
jgi:hypothetical protein